MGNGKLSTSVHPLVMQLHEVDGLDGDGAVALYVKGVYPDMDDFLAGCLAYCEHTGNDLRPRRPRIAYWRLVPNRATGGSVFKNAVRGSRGSFKVTVSDLRDWSAA